MAVETWAEVLAEIPVDELQNYYVITMRNRDSTFPLGADEILTRWRKEPPRRKTIIEQLQEQGVKTILD
jgi:hypothetical protein